MSRNGLIPPKSKRKKKSLQHQNKSPSAEPKENEHRAQGARTETKPGRNSDRKPAPEKFIERHEGVALTAKIDGNQRPKEEAPLSRTRTVRTENKQLRSGENLKGNMEGRNKM
jgi:cell division protein FtsN